jgi:hypothetical protein
MAPWRLQNSVISRENRIPCARSGLPPAYPNRAKPQYFPGKTDFKKI